MDSVQNAILRAEVFLMSYVNPALRREFESIPIEIKNEILESGAVIQTREDLQRCVELVKKRGNCCGDL